MNLQCNGQKRALVPANAGSGASLFVIIDCSWSMLSIIYEKVIFYVILGGRIIMIIEYSRRACAIIGHILPEEDRNENTGS